MLRNNRRAQKDGPARRRWLARGVAALAAMGALALTASGYSVAATAPPASAQTVTLSLAPSAVSATVGETARLVVQADVGDQPLDGVQIELTFPPALLEATDADSSNAGVQISPGSTLPTVLYNAVDNAAGRIHYAAGVELGTASRPSGSFVLATVTFRTKAAGAATVRFGEGTKASYEGAALPMRTADSAVSVRTPDAPPAPVPPTPVPLTRPDPPQLLGPAGGTVAEDMSPALRWRQADSATQFHIRVIPANDDGPGINMIIGDPAQVARSQYQVLPPDMSAGANFVLLPGMSYRWEVRVAAAATPLGEDAEAWSGWTRGDFRTPGPASESISPQSPAPGAAVATLTPHLTWANRDARIFYYEVQVSQDPTFTSDPATAIAPLYWELIHGGVTAPPNTYAIPAAMPLEAAAVYYWRVRPRVQGDGTPVAWSTAWEFRTP